MGPVVRLRLEHINKFSGRGGRLCVAGRAPAAPISHLGVLLLLGISLSRALLHEHSRTTMRRRRVLVSDALIDVLSMQKLAATFLCQGNHDFSILAVHLPITVRQLES